MTMATQTPVKRPARLGGSSFWTTAIFAMLILIPCFVAFSNKLREFILLYRHQVDGIFAISPIVNYLLASLGFFFLFWWGVCNGMFSQMEQPKRSFLEQERRLDAEQARYEADESHHEDYDGLSIYERSARMK
jgi:hypothetical protein